MSNYVQTLADKKVAIIGCGKTGLSGAQYLVDKVASVKMFDGNLNISEQNAKILSDLNIDFCTNGIDDEILEYDIIFLSPGVPRALASIQKAIKKGIDIVNDIELLHRIKPEAKIIAITGSNGKTTTTNLVGEVFSKQYKTAVGGNIGTPVLDLIDEDFEIFVLELSSFQIESLTQFKADVSVVLNITPDHLDRYKSMEEYTDTKRKLCSLVKNDATVIINSDDMSLDNIETIADIEKFSSSKVADAYVKNGSITFGENSLNTSDIFIKGNHNYENIMASILIALHFDISVETIKDVVTSFKGVEHRLELVRTVNGISYYNDSKATNPDSVVCALKSFGSPIIWLAGGKSKNTPLNDIMSIAPEHVKYAIFFGESRELFEKNFNGIINNHVVETVEEAVAEATLIASNSDNIVLSPGCTSFDAYPSYIKRGEHFKELVGNIVAN